MKVVQVLYSGLGGHGSVAFSLAAADKKKQNNYSFVFYGIEKTRDEYIGKCEQNNYTHRSILKKIGFDLFSFIKYIKILVILKPDVVLLHSALILPTYLYKIFFGCKIICVEHQNNQYKSKKELYISKFNLKLANKVIFLTPDYFTYFNIELQNRGLKQVVESENVQVIPNGVSSSVFYPSTKVVDGDMLQFGMASRINDLRDYFTIFRSLLILKKQNIQFHFTVAGSGDKPENLDNLKQEVEQLGISSQVTFLGNVNEQGMRSFFNEIDVYIHSSKAETLSTSIIQAMASRKMIVATNIVGINNMLTNKKNSLLFELSDEIELAQILATLYDQHELINEYSLKAYELYQKKYSNEVMFEAYKMIMNS